MQPKNKKNPNSKFGAVGGEDATRTHNALRHTTFPMWLLTIRIPLRMLFLPRFLSYYTPCSLNLQDLFFCFFILCYNVYNSILIWNTILILTKFVNFARFKEDLS